MQPNNIRNSLDQLLISQSGCDIEKLQHQTREQTYEAIYEMHHEPKMSLAVSKNGDFNIITFQEVTNNLKVTAKDFFPPGNEHKHHLFLQQEDDAPIDQSQTKTDNKSLFQDRPKTKKIRILSQNKQKVIENQGQSNTKYINKNKNIMRDICSKCALYIQTNPRATCQVDIFIEQDEENKKLIKRQIQNLRKIKNFQEFRHFYGRDELVIQFIKSLTIKFYDEDAFVYIMNSQISYKQQTINQLGYFKHCINNRLHDFNQYRKWQSK